MIDADADDAATDCRRRTLLGAIVGAGTASLAGCPAPGGDGDGDGDAPTATTTAGDETARRLAEQFAPTLYFDAAERWFPTDPRPYTSEQDGETVVDGFDAFNGYTRRYDEAGAPPDPTVFYHVVAYDDSPLAVVQFWFYSAFDQFATNFHWHDWEVLHVFVDTASGDPQLFVASSHSGRVPNNEYLDPDARAVPRILSELGSHSSALSVNDRPESFQRLPLGDLPADITNRAVGAVEALAELPAAYGLPRDEGLRLPYLIPELDGVPIHEHDRLPAVDRDTLVPETLTVRSFDALSTPPTDLPARETGVRFDHAGRSVDADVTYDLVPTSEVTHIADFTGPQLSFEFAVPSFAEDAVAAHITTAGTPWTQERYDDPAADITDPAHRSALAERYDAVAPPGPLNDLVATVSEVVQSPDAPDGAGVRTTTLGIEAVALLRSDPVAAPTFRGVAMLRSVEAGSHRLTVNGAGLAPHAEPVEVGDSGGGTDPDVTASATPTALGTDDVARTTTLAGVDGEIPLVASEDALKLEVNADGVEANLTDFAVDDDFGGRLYEAPMDGSDAVYIHHDGAYTAEVRDTDDAVGAFRVNPSDITPVRIDRPRTGKASLASFVETITTETADRLASVGGGDDGAADTAPGAAGATSTLGGLLRAMEAVSGAAARAVERAERGDRRGTDRALQALATNLQRTVERFDGLRDTLPDPVAAATDRRFREARRRTNQAIASEKL
ncbi:MAG: hypothetical protein ABEJ73_12285 [Haloplanus sp.]